MNKSEIPFRLPCPVECSCGAKMSRRHDTRRKVSQELWTCQNPDCKRIVNINDDLLLIRITEVLNRLIDDPLMIRADAVDDADPPLEIRRLQNEVNRQLDGFDFEKDEVKASIFSLAAEKYWQMDNKKIITQMLRAEFENQTPLSLFSPELFKRTVIGVWFNDDGEPIIVLKNDQNINIGKEHDHADHNDTGNTTGNHAAD